MPPKANKRKTNGNGKGEEKKTKYLHGSDSDTPSPSPGNEQRGDFFPYDQYDFHLHRSPTETLYQSETNEEDTPLMENDQKRTWGKHSPPRSQ